MSRKLFGIPQPLMGFYILVVYVIIQFAWWLYLLIDLNDQVIFLNAQIEPMPTIGSNLSDMQKQKHLMVIGEGVVFLILLILGIIQTRKSFKRESELARQQHNFMLSVTHELKTPLASLKLFLQTIFKHELPREKQIMLATKALRESERLDQLIENILLINRMDSDGFALHPECISISALTSEISEQFKHAFAEQKTELRLIIQDQVLAFVDALAYRSVLENLLDNALKYANNSECISVELYHESNEAVLKVSDQGKGIPDNEKQKVFERFYRSGREENRKTKGTGLGLFIVRSLILAMDGKIILSDNQPSGCIFELRFKSNS